MSVSIKISQLAEGGNIQSQDVIPVARSGETYKIPASQFVLDGQNIGGSSGEIFSGKVTGAGTSLRFRTLSGAEGITVGTQGQTVVISASGQNPVKTKFFGNGVATTFSIVGANSVNPNNYRIDIDGVLQEPGQDYTISGSNIIFTDAPPLSSKVVVVATNLVRAFDIIPSDGSVTSNKIALSSVALNKLESTIVNLLNQITYVQTEAVIGSTECKFGFFGETTKARGDTYFDPATINAVYLADLKWVNEQGTIELVRMENVNPLTYSPWQNFFPYKPTGKVVSTKISAKISNMDSTGSNDDLSYTLYVNWDNNKAIITGNYILASYNGGTANQTFIKQWDFTSGADATIRTDYQDSGIWNTLGERPYAVTFNTYTGDCELVIGVSPTGITKLPVFKYNGPSDPTINETANISLFIENTFRF